MMVEFRDEGFSFIEVLIGLTILLAAMGTLMQVAASGQRLARSHAEASDLHQRVRVAAEKLQKDLALAGAGTLRGPLSGGLTGYMAPLLPARMGARLPDTPLSAFTDRVSIVYVADSAWPSTLSVSMAAAGDPVFVNAAAAGCPAAGLCGFSEGTRALLVDTGDVGAGHDLFTVTGIAGALAHDSPNLPFERPYVAGRSIVVPVVQRVYYFDRANRRLMTYDGYQSDMPVIDNVVDVRFSYFADGSASSVVRPSEGTGNCVYDAGAPSPAPRGLWRRGPAPAHARGDDRRPHLRRRRRRVRWRSAPHPAHSHHAAPAGGRRRGPWRRRTVHPAWTLVERR